MNLILHTFKKDIQHYWPLVAIWLIMTAGLAFFDAIAPTLVFKPKLWVTYQIVSIVGPMLQFLLLVVLVPLVIQDDPLADNNAFWLTRPIARKQLLQGKLLFLGVIVLLPMLLAETLALACNDASASQILLGDIETLFNNIVFLTIVLVLAALTANFSRFAIAGVLYIIGAMIVGGCCLLFASRFAMFKSAVDLMITSILTSRLLLVGALTILVGGLIIRMQFLGRKTRTAAFAAISCAVVLVIVKCFAPWDLFGAYDRRNLAEGKTVSVPLMISKGAAASGADEIVDVQSKQVIKAVEANQAPNFSADICFEPRYGDLEIPYDNDPRIKQKKKDIVVIDFSEKEKQQADQVKKYDNEMTESLPKFFAAMQKRIGNFTVVGTTNNYAIVPTNTVPWISFERAEASTNKIEHFDFNMFRCEMAGETRLKDGGTVRKGTDAFCIIKSEGSDKNYSVTLRIRDLHLSYDSCSRMERLDYRIEPWKKQMYALVNRSRSNEVAINQSVRLPDTWSAIMLLTRMMPANRLFWYDITVNFPALSDDWLKNADLIWFKQKYTGIYRQKYVVGNVSGTSTNETAGKKESAE